MSQIAVTQRQGIGLMEALGEMDEQGAVITAQGQNIYVATTASSCTITPEGEITEEDFG